MWAALFARNHSGSPQHRNKKEAILCRIGLTGTLLAARSWTSRSLQRPSTGQGEEIAMGMPSSSKLQSSLPKFGAVSVVQQVQMRFTQGACSSRNF